MTKNKKKRYIDEISFLGGSISDNYNNENNIDLDYEVNNMMPFDYGTASESFFDGDETPWSEELPDESLFENKPSVSTDIKGSKNDKESKGTEYELYKKILKMYVLVSCQGKLSLYNTEHGFFTELSNIDLRVIVRRNWEEEVLRQLNRYKVDEIIDKLVCSSELQIDVDAFDRYEYLINFQNCVLDIRNMHTYSHDPKYLFSSYIQADYQEYSEYQPLEEKSSFLQLIYNITEEDEDKILLVQEVFGYCLSNYSNAKKWFCFLGVPHSGKSTLLELLKILVGPSYTCAVPLHRLNERFLIAELYQKKLNISGELHNGDIKQFDILKAATGGDTLVAEKKGKDPFYFHNKAKMVFAGNQMPSIAKLDSTSAFTDRIVFLLFNRTVPEEERDLRLIEKLSEERDFIVRWAMDGLRRLVGNRFVFTEPADSALFKKQYLNSLNNVQEFVQDNCELRAGLRVLKRDLYSQYLIYCNENCMKVLTKEEFFTEIAKFPVEIHKFRYRGSNPLFGYHGITLKTHLFEE
ncbi:phage/plasmid primase, P4 family [Paenibacillus sp. S150]|uniref:DNA primase family protein n=1 Tax=Paenibacillus sp. S150 TaxID=2749826 RepID=UPI001C58501E|nr:phage/plasmid primase, P4 family [Paenibacillus sp. S150]MBW4084088.1 hypothetical protein [Paenibacillus sp. S150]